jgi:hypothetical protein
LIFGGGDRLATDLENGLKRPKFVRSVDAFLGKGLRGVFLELGFEFEGDFSVPSQMPLEICSW